MKREMRMQIESVQSELNTQIDMVKSELKEVSDDIKSETGVTNHWSVNLCRESFS